ncbi:MAG: serine/threonine-protein kinase [Planctomycetaceae bacterium]|nr:serine/threonine-protein kinase [Planctomycetaceae bacterium]
MQLSFYQGIQAESNIWYNNLQWLGQGGNATTYLMVAGSGNWTGNQFAVKIFHNIEKPERRESFLEEIKFLKNCDHPSILRIYDEGIFQNLHPFVVMEYLPQTLREVIRSRQSTMIEKLSYTVQLLSALSYLDSLDNPVIHRDIKPENIFLKSTSCVLGDFGLLKRLDCPKEDDWTDKLKESVGVGMPFYYRTPDLVDYALGKAMPTTKSDLFQVGLVIAELFTGTNPEQPVSYDEMLSEVTLNQIGFVPGASHLMVKDLLAPMLEIAPDDRPEIKESLTAWQGLFRSVAEQVHAIEGKVF